MVMVIVKVVSIRVLIVMHISMIQVAHIQPSSPLVMFTREHLMLPVVIMYKYSDVVMVVSMDQRAVMVRDKRNVLQGIFVVRVIVSKSSPDPVGQ